MHRPNKAGGGSQGRLSRSLEFKIAKYFTQYKEQGNSDWTLASLLEYVQNVDSSLRRMKKRQIEQAIERGNVTVNIYLFWFLPSIIIVLDNFDPTLSGEDEDE
jgi:ribosome biogenesis ATPase